MQDKNRGQLETEKLQLEVQALRAQQSAAQERSRLEIDKLLLENEELRRRQSPWVIPLVSLVGGLGAGLLGGLFSMRSALNVSERTREGALDQAVHEKRLETYPLLVRAISPLAIFFPDYGWQAGTLQPRHCAAMGQAMSRWYFADGGLLLSDDAKKVYFALARVLTRAAAAKTLHAPHFPDDGQEISDVTLKRFQKTLAIAEDKDSDSAIETWEFGAALKDDPSPSDRFRDYVFLQRRSSMLRSQLTEDLGSRRRPGTD